MNYLLGGPTFHPHPLSPQTGSLLSGNQQSLPGIDAGTVVPLGLSTSAMTIEEMKDLIELIHAFGAERGVIFADPQEPTNPNTDETPTSASSVDADPPSASEAVDETPTPSTASNPITKETMIHFEDYGRKAIQFATEKGMKAADRAEKIENLQAQYRKAIPEADWSIFEEIQIAIEAVFHGKRSIQAAADYIKSVLAKHPIKQLETQ